MMLPCFESHLSVSARPQHSQCGFASGKWRTLDEERRSPRCCPARRAYRSAGERDHRNWLWWNHPAFEAIGLFTMESSSSRDHLLNRLVRENCMREAHFDTAYVVEPLDLIGAEMCIQRA